MPLLKCTDYVPYISTYGLLVVTGPCHITQVHGLRTTFLEMACWCLLAMSLKCTDNVPYISTDGLLLLLVYATSLKTILPLFLLVW